VSGTDDTPPLTAEAGMRCLAENGDFLDNLAQSIPAKESIDSKIIDLTPAIAKRARGEARRIGQQNRSIISLAAENMVNWQRLHHAALALLATADSSELFDVLTHQFPAIFDLAACHLVTASPLIHAMAGDHPPHLCTPDKLAQITAGRTLTLGLPDPEVSAILKETAASVAIIALPDQLSEPVADSILILCGHEETSFTPDLGDDLLVLLAEMVGVALTAWLERLDRTA